jgi:poly-gamma-glutamate synthesis protein (capsule biosynthesis protein)
MITVLIGGDVVPINRSLQYFKNGDVNQIFNDLIQEFKKSDFSIVNLECPLINKDTPIQKSGPVLGVQSSCINGFKEARIDALNLANNHIMDHGPEGLKNTLNECTKAGILTVGSGKNLAEARQILIRKIGNFRIGILGLAEHEFSIAKENSWGANPLDLIDYVRNVDSQRANFDYLIVLLHGGNEHYRLPSPRLKETCRFLVEMGANAVIVQHTHCPGCYEEYKNAHIVYGQGNLIFDAPNKAMSFYEGFLVNLLIFDDLTSKLEIIPYFQSGEEVGARKMNEHEKQIFLNSLMERSNQVKDDSYVKAQWLEFCKKKKHQYLSNVLCHNRIFKTLNKNGFLLKIFYKKQDLVRLGNVISCESHKEVLDTIFDHRMI